MRNILAILVLFALWLLMSGIYKPLIIGLGLGSAIFAVLVVRRMDRIDRAQMDLKIDPIGFLAYFGWLLVEIAKANWAVAKLILAPEMKLNQTFLHIPYGQKTSVAKTIFANSITLTPGTITVEVEDGTFLVHAVDYSDGDTEAIADMNARVCALETR